MMDRGQKEFRWWDELVELGRLGRASGKAVRSFGEIEASDGLHREEGTDSMRISTDFLLERMEQTGLEVLFDEAGNLFGILRGSDPSLPLIATGSHLDSVSDGGMFDGVAGVVAALESLRTIRTSGYRPNHDLALVVFMGEEGSSIDEACLGSRFLCKTISRERLYGLANNRGEHVDLLLKRSGKLRIPAHASISPARIGAFLELHIEQGSRLDREHLPLGLVRAIYGIRAYRITCIGQSNHAGSTPMSYRSDALYTATRIISSLISQVSKLCEHGFDGVLTADTLEVFPGAPSIIPGKVVFTLDTRSGTAEGLDTLRQLVDEELTRSVRTGTVEIEIESIMDYEPAVLDHDLMKTMEYVLTMHGIPYRTLSSGAIHDAMHMAACVPTTLLFVRSKDGVSHSPFEWSDREDIGLGIKVLTETILEIDGSHWKSKEKQ